MKIQFSIVGHVEHPPDVWADLPAVPRVGDVVNLPGLPQWGTVVRTVVWYPTHDDEGEPLDEPFVYVVLGSPRREEHGVQSMHRRPVGESDGGGA